MVSLTGIIKNLSRGVALGLILAGGSLGCGESHRPVIGGGGTPGEGQPCIDEICQQDDDDNGGSRKSLNKIDFVSNRSGSKQIYMMDPDGNNVERLTHITKKNPGLQYNIGRISRSPDGTLFFDSNLDGDWDIYYISNGKIIKWTDEDPIRRHQDRNLAFLPDGTLLYDSDEEGNGDIFMRYIDERDEGGPINLTENGAIDESPSSSPDGRHIAFNSNRGAPYQEIYVMVDYGKVYSGETRRLLPEEGFSNGSPCWSPRWSPISLTGAEYITYHCEVDGNVDIYKTRITDGSNEQSRLTSEPSVEHSASWSPSGRQIAYVCEGKGNKEICVMDDDGNNLRNVTNSPADEQSPAWW